LKLNSSEKLILELVSFTDQISRKQISEVSDLSPSSVTNITKHLIDQQYIEEGQRIGEGMGRKEVLLHANPHKFHFLGIDIGGFNVRIAISDNHLNILSQTEIRMVTLNHEEDKAAALLKEVQAFLARCNFLAESISAIGIGVTGIVGMDFRTILNIPNNQTWNNVNLTDPLAAFFHCPIFLEEGGRTMALLEMKIGKAKTFNDFITVHVGHGIAAGIIINGQMMRGVNNTAGLLGHITADPTGNRCLCGNYGCLENIITFPMLDRSYVQQNGEHKHIADGFALRDKRAIEVCLKAGEAFGIALSNTVNLFNPQALLIGGRMFDLMPLLFEETKRTIMLRANQFSTLSLKIDKSSFGEDEGILGALVLAKARLIEHM